MQDAFTHSINHVLKHQPEFITHLICAEIGNLDFIKPTYPDLQEKILALTSETPKVTNTLSTVPKTHAPPDGRVSRPQFAHPRQTMSRSHRNSDGNP